MNRFSILTLIFIGLLCIRCSKNTQQFALEFEPDVSENIHGLDELKQALTANGFIEGSRSAAITFALQIDESSDVAESFSIQNRDNVITITGTDKTGLMYGIQNVKDQLLHFADITQIQEIKEQPYMPFRAIKFNLPWDSYRRSPALQMHMETCRDLNFWKEFLDMMAENRFNTLTLWNLHPFSYMVKVDNYPEALSVDEDEFDDWKKFWKSLFQMAKDRGIETYIVNWNIFISPEFAEAHNVATYSIDHQYFSQGDTSAIIKNYTKEAVKQVINEYPNLTGLGISMGEGMGGMTPAERESWVLETIIAGMKEADRKARLIHRVPFSANKGSGGSTDKSTETMTRTAIESISLPSPVWVEVKFNWSHGHSTPELVKVHGGSISDTYWNPLPENYSLTWMIRNEDFFCLRWGQPDFIRKHLELNSKSYVGGYYVGSECYIPAVDYFTKSQNRDWKYAFERQWLFYKTWGRLLYNPNTANEVFIHAFKDRYGSNAGEKLFQAYALVSNVPLQIASMRDVKWDFTLYSEGFIAWNGETGKTEFIDIDNLIQEKPLDPHYVSIIDYVAKKLNNEEFTAVITPSQTADKLSNQCMEALEFIEGINGEENTALHYEIADIRIWANLGLYFTEKIKGGIALQTFRMNANKEEQNKAVQHLEQAATYWQKIVDITEPLYKQMPLVHLNNNTDEHFHWSNYIDEVDMDIETAKNAVQTNSD